MNDSYVLKTENGKIILPPEKKYKMCLNTAVYVKLLYLQTVYLNTEFLSGFV